MAELVIELLTLIFIHLHVKSLLRLKSVSKAWYSLISSPYFIDLHRNNHRSDNRFLIATLVHNSSRLLLQRRSLDSKLSLTTEFLPPTPFDTKNYNSVRVLGSCHGLLILHLCYDYNLNMSSEFDLTSSELIMWNPSTNNYMVLPRDGSPNSRVLVRTNHRYGFGYDKSTNDYKFVFFSRLSSGMGLKSETYHQRVYSAKRNSWGPPLVLDSSNLNRWGGCEAALVEPAIIDDHILHWLFGEFRNPTQSNIEIRGFDICTEKWLDTEVPFPDFGVGAKYSVERELGVLDNCLCLVICPILKKGRGEYAVWVMKEYGVKESWTKLSTIGHGCIFSPPIAQSNYGDQLLIYINSDIFGHVWYDLKDKTVRSTCISNINNINLTVCAESLVWVSAPVIGSFKREVVTKTVMEVVTKTVMEDEDLELERGIKRRKLS